MLFLFFILKTYSFGIYIIKGEIYYENQNYNFKWTR